VACACLILFTAAVLTSRNADDQPAAPEPPRLAAIAAARDSAAFDSALAVDAAGVRRYLKTAVTDLTRRAAEGADAAGGGESLGVNWLVDRYTGVTSVGDLSRQRDLLYAWGPAQAAAKTTCDSLFRRGNRVFQRERDDGRAGAGARFLSLLDTLAARYAALGDGPGRAAVWSYRAGILEQGGDLAVAIAAADSARALAEAFDAPDLLGDVHLRRSEIALVRQADYLAAGLHHRQAVEAFRRIGDQRRILTAALQQFYALHQLNRTEEALRAVREAMQSARHLNDRRSESYCAHVISECLFDLGDFDSALTYNDRCTSLRLPVDIALPRPSALSDLGYALATRGLVLHALGRTSDARYFYEWADSLFSKAVDTLGLFLSGGRLGNLLLDEGRWEDAEGVFLPILARAGKFETRLAAAYGLGVAEYRRGRPQEARIYLRECVRQCEQMRGRLPSPDLQLGMLADKAGFYDLLVVTFLEEYMAGGSSASLDSALAYLDLAQARSLVESAGEAVGSPCPEENRLLSRLSDLQFSLLVDRDDPAGLGRSQRALEDSLFAARVECAAVSPSDSHPPALPTSRTLCSTVLPRDLVLCWVLSPAGTFAIALSADTVVVRPLAASRDEIAELVREFVAAVAAYPTARDFPESPYHAPGRKLYDILLKPFVNEQDTTRLTVIAPGALAGLPVGALVDAHGRFVVESREVVYAPALSMLARHPEEAERSDPRRMLAFGDARYDDNSVLSGLPFSSEELDRISRVYGANASVYADSAATEANVRRTADSWTGILHLAVHGLVDPDDWSRSALSFSFDSDGRGSGLLHASEIAHLNIPAALVFLSACESGSGRQIAGEGVMSLARSFLAAGAGSVISTLWRVDDRASAEFVGQFYDRMAAAAPPAEAIAEAQRLMIHSDRPLYRHPYFWASYVLTQTGARKTK